MWKRLHLRILIRSGLPLLAAGVVLAIVGGAFLPGIIVWLGVAMLVWEACTSFAREHPEAIRNARQGWHFQQPSASRRKHRPGEAYDQSVRLTFVPNVPLAEMMCSQLRAHGIEAFYKGASTLGRPGVGIADLNPALPAEVWVGEQNLEQALHLIQDSP